MAVSLPTRRGRARLPTKQGSVDIWRVDLDRVPDTVHDLLCPQELARAARILPEGRRTLWIRSRGTLRMLLGRYLDRDPRELAFSLGAHGKPALVAADGRPHELRFNLSHSRELMLVALSFGRDVGVDVECARERCTTEFLRAWALREAMSKCLGTGLYSEPGPETEAEKGMEFKTEAKHAHNGALSVAMWTSELEVGPRAVGVIALRDDGTRRLRYLDAGSTLMP